MVNQPRKNLLSVLAGSSTLDARVMLAASRPRTITVPAKTHTETYTADTGDEKSGSRYKKTGSTENFQVAEGENKETKGLDARVENGFTERVKKTGGRDFTFTGSYNVESAKDTTIFQILNIDKKDKDSSRPVLFIEAETYVNKDGKPKVKLFEKNAKGKGAIYDGDREFDLKVETNGKQADIFVNGKKAGNTVKFDRYKDQKGIQLGDDKNVNEIRYGAYHHDRRTIPKKERDAAKGTGDAKVTQESASQANISVTDAKLVREAYTTTRRK